MYQIFFFLITYSLIAVLRKEIKSSILFIVPSLPPILITSPHLNRGLFSGVLPTKFSFHEHPYELVLALQRVLLMAPYMFFFPEKSFRSLVFLVLPSPVFSSHTELKNLPRDFPLGNQPLLLFHLVQGPIHRSTSDSRAYCDDI